MTKKIAIIATSFHRDEIAGMVKIARKTAKEEGLRVVKEVWVPGCYEVPLTLKRLLPKDEIDGAVVLGIIEKGATKHGMVMGIVVHQAIVDLELATGKPVGLGILGPEILPTQVPSRAEYYAKKSVLAVKTMLDYNLITRKASANLPTLYGNFRILVYKSDDGLEHTALVMKKNTTLKPPVLTRVHSQCLTGDALLSRKCDCRAQLHESMRLVQKKGEGIIVYLNQEGRGIGLANKIKAYALQDRGYDTAEANEALGVPIDARDYKIAAAILRDLGIRHINLLTNNPEKIRQLARYRISVSVHTRLRIKPDVLSQTYMRTKKRKLGHLLRI